MRIESVYLFTPRPAGGIIQRDGRVLDPADSLRFVNHSPDGFAWGYGGSGPSQAAFAICLDFFGDEEEGIPAPRMAEAIYQDFKRKFLVERSYTEPTELTGVAIWRWLQERVGAFEVED